MIGYSPAKLGSNYDGINRYSGDWTDIFILIGWAGAGFLLGSLLLYSDPKDQRIAQKETYKSRLERYSDRENSGHEDLGTLTANLTTIPESDISEKINSVENEGKVADKVPLWQRQIEKLLERRGKVYLDEDSGENYSGEDKGLYESESGESAKGSKVVYNVADNVSGEETGPESDQVYGITIFKLIFNTFYNIIVTLCDCFASNNNHLFFKFFEISTR